LHVDDRRKQLFLMERGQTSVHRRVLVVRENNRKGSTGEAEVGNQVEVRKKDGLRRVVDKHGFTGHRQEDRTLSAGLRGESGHKNGTVGGKWEQLGAGLWTVGNEWE